MRPPARRLARRKGCDMEIRDAVLADAPAACAVLRRSITELCVADHRNDPAILERWLANKTPEIVASWIAQPAISMLVAVEGGIILAVGAVTNAGEITLNYVSPDARFRGVSRAMLGALEARAAERGNTRCTLISTATARRFYHAAGYVEDGPPQGKFGTTGSYPYMFIERLATEWASGGMRFDRAGEALLVVHVHSEIAAVGGLTVDPAIPEALRMRRFYVGKRFRRRGIGRRLAAALLEAAVRTDRPVTVNAAAGSEPFWEPLGFVAEGSDGHTHVLKRSGNS